MLRRYHSPFHYLPLDILYPILAQLTDRRDWHACSLVSKTFCRVATPFLYRTLDSRIISKNWVHHPSTTLLRRPDLALYVRHITETGGIQRGMSVRNPNITADTLAALSLCINLRSMTWIDDSSSSDATLLAFLDVLRTLPVRELTIRTHSDLSETVWTQLVSLTGLRKVSIWCMEGPPRALQGGQWSGPLGSTLTHLELGVSAFLYPCSELLAQLPLLKDLRLKGAPATSIPTILTYLPNLQSLDTEYLLSGSGFHQSKYPRVQHHDEVALQLGGAHSGLASQTRNGRNNHNHTRGTLEEGSAGIRRNDGTSGGSSSSSPSSPISPMTISSQQHYSQHSTLHQQPLRTPPPNYQHHHQHGYQLQAQDRDDEQEQQHQYEPVRHPSPALKHLTVRTRTLDSLGGPGPQKLWDWVRELVPLPGLETFKLHAFVYSTVPHHSSSSSSSSSSSCPSTSNNPSSSNGFPSLSSSGTGNATGGGIPRQFILDLALTHADTLKHFMVDDVYVSLEDVQCLADMFPKLETIVCATASPNVASIVRAISGARNLQTLKLQVEWLPDPKRMRNGTRGEGEGERRGFQVVTTTKDRSGDLAVGSDIGGNWGRDWDEDDRHGACDGEICEAPETRNRDCASALDAYRGCGYNGDHDRTLGASTWTYGSVSSSSTSSNSQWYYRHQYQQQLQQQKQQQKQHQRHYEQQQYQLQFQQFQQQRSSWISPYHYNACFAPRQIQNDPRKQQWSQFGDNNNRGVVVPTTHPYRYDESRFTLEDATRMMLRTDESKLRNISVGHMQYTGKWVLQDPEELAYGHVDPNWTTVEEKLKFVVTAEVAEDNWRT